MWGGKKSILSQAVIISPVFHARIFIRHLSFAIRRSAAQQNVNINYFLDFSRVNTYVLYLPSHQLSTKIVDCTTLATFKWNQMETVKKRGSISFITRFKSTWRHQTNKNLSNIKCVVPRWLAADVSGDSGRFLYLLFPCVRTVTAVRLRIYGHEILIWPLFSFMFMVGISSSAEMGSR